MDFVQLIDLLLIIPKVCYSSSINYFKPIIINLGFIFIIHLAIKLIIHFIILLINCYLIINYHLGYLFIQDFKLIIVSQLQ